MRLKTWTVTAIDQFGRIFNYTQVQHPYWEDFTGQYAYTFERMVREILIEMGTAARGYWDCREDEIIWDHWENDYER